MRIDGRRGLQANVVKIDGRLLLPSRSIGLRRHSPTGFAWGYSGSGPAQLALAICLELVPEETALECYQVFKVDFVSTWDEDFSVEIDFWAWFVSWLASLNPKQQEVVLMDIVHLPKVKQFGPGDLGAVVKDARDWLLGNGPYSYLMPLSLAFEGNDGTGDQVEPRFVFLIVYEQVKAGG